jgi:hypothetical protein
MHSDSFLETPNEVMQIPLMWLIMHLHPECGFTFIEVVGCDQSTQFRHYHKKLPGGRGVAAGESQNLGTQF